MARITVWTPRPHARGKAFATAIPPLELALTHLGHHPVPSVASTPREINNPVVYVPPTLGHVTATQLTATLTELQARGVPVLVFVEDWSLFTVYSPIRFIPRRLANSIVWLFTIRPAVVPQYAQFLNIDPDRIVPLDAGWYFYWVGCQYAADALDNPPSPRRAWLYVALTPRVGVLPEARWPVHVLGRNITPAVAQAYTLIDGPTSEYGIWTQVVPLYLGHVVPQYDLPGLCRSRIYYLAAQELPVAFEDASDAELFLGSAARSVADIERLPDAKVRAVGNEQARAIRREMMPRVEFMERLRTALAEVGVV